MSAEYKLNLAPKTLENADPRQRELLEQARAQVGFIPNMYAGMVNCNRMLGTGVDIQHPAARAVVGHPGFEVAQFGRIGTDPVGSGNRTIAGLGQALELRQR